MKIGDKIGEGRYRQCFAVSGTNLCVKKPKERLRKTYFGFQMSLSMKLYTFFKFLTTNFNQREYQIFCSLPAELKDYLPDIIKLVDNLLFLQRPKDFDGAYSTTVQKMGAINNASFWEHIDRIVDVLVKNNLFLLDTFYFGNNIIVQRISREEWRPVLVDVKRLGFYTYPLQLHLVFKSQQRRKFLRRLQRFKNFFKVE